MKINLNERATQELLALRDAMGTNHALQHIVNVLISEAYKSKIVVPQNEEKLNDQRGTIQQ